ncbi:hypothetical protein EON65_44735 [archaeon]|nr:MAG: hypothetical protein EON65_44735 [archaeon]
MESLFCALSWPSYFFSNDILWHLGAVSWQRPSRSQIKQSIHNRSLWDFDFCITQVHMKNSNLVKHKVLVIGNGAAGSKVAAYAAKNKHYDVTVVTPFEYMEISLCMTKVIATGAEEHNKAIYDLLREPKVTYIIDTVTSLTDGLAILSSGTNVPFDVCVVASGQNIPMFYPNPNSERTMEARKNTIKKVCTICAHI